MTLDTTEIVAVTMETQADKADANALTAERLSASHQGARDVIKTIEAAMKGVTPAAEKEIEENPDLTAEARTIALKVVARAMVRVAHVLGGVHANHQNMIYLKQGEAKAMKDMAASLRKQAKTRRDGERAKAESVAMGDANKAAKAKAKPKRKRVAAKAKAKPNGVKAGTKAKAISPADAGAKTN
jgi:hypothetical protein